MATNKLIITAKNAAQMTGKRFIDAAYEYFDEEDNRVKVRALLSNGDVVEVQRTKEVKKALLELNSDNMYSIEIELGRAGVSDDLLMKWASGHPDMDNTSSGEKRTGALYSYTITGEALEVSFNEDDEKADVFAKYRTLSESEHKAIAIYFGIEPWRFDEKELRNTLVGFTGGVISCDRERRNEFLNHIDAMFDYKVLNVQSGILCGVIVNEDGVYTLEGVSMGRSKEYVVATIKERPDLYSILERRLKERGRYLTPHNNGEDAKVRRSTRKKSDEEFEMQDLGINEGSFGLAGKPKQV